MRHKVSDAGGHNHEILLFNLTGMDESARSSLYEHHLKVMKEITGRKD